jgi:hypothetical protein
VPPCASNETGLECLEFAAAHGIDLDDWQSWVLTESLGTKTDGTWSAFEVAEIIARQNGKNATVEVRELFGLFVLSEPLIIHTAHEFKASNEHFLRVQDKIKSDADLDRRIKSIITSHGEEAVLLRPMPSLIFGPGRKMIRKSVAPRLRFLARSRGSGRSFTCDCLVWDEAMILSDDQVGASMPTMSAVPNPQLWYLASAGYPDSTQLASIRKRGIHGDPDLAFFEWSIRPHNELCPRDERNGRRTNRYIVCDKHDDRDDPANWAKANPALGIRITEQHVAKELKGMPPDTFDVERLGAGQWPTDDEDWGAITQEQWDACQVKVTGGTVTPVCFAFDVTPNLDYAAIAVAWQRPSDGRVILEIPRLKTDGLPCFRRGTGWVVPALLDLRKRWRPLGIAAPKTAPASALIDDAENHGIELLKMSSTEEAQAFTLMITGIRGQLIGHLGPDDAPEMRTAAKHAETRDIGDGMRGWSRKNSATDITPLTAGTAAYWAFNKKRRNYDPVASIG